MSGGAWFITILYLAGVTLIACAFTPYARRSRRVAGRAPLHLRMRARLLVRHVNGKPLNDAERQALLDAERGYALPPSPELAAFEREIEIYMKEMTSAEGDCEW